MRSVLTLLFSTLALTTYANMPVPGPPSTEWHDLALAASISAVGFSGILILRRVRKGRVE